MPTSDLPVFASVEQEDQVSQLRKCLKSLGVQIAAEPKGDITRDTIDLVDHCHALSQMDTDNDVENVLNAIVSLIVIVPLGQTKEIVKKFCKQLSENFQPKSARALINVLSNLFHGVGNVENKPLQYDIYCTMLKIAGSSGQLRSVPTNLDKLKEWFIEWKSTTEQKALCLRLLHDTLTKCQQTEAPAKVMIELLSLYTEDTADKARDDAKQTIRAAIADPATYIFDHLLKLSPVQKLEKEKIYSLLKIFVSGSLQDYQTFYSANKDFVGSLGLNHEALVQKMRILTFMTIGEQRNEVSFEEMAEKLQLPLKNEQELESFIIQAVQTKMIKAKIDEISGRVLISGAKHREFAKPQWELLRQKLDAWHGNLSTLKTYLDTVAVDS